MGSLGPGAAAALAAVAVIALYSLALAAARARRRRGASRKAVRRAARALAGDATGAALLEAAGYQLLDTQARLTWTVRCDDEPVEVELRCDALVGRDGRRLVAEVKTGDRAPSLATAATRRQLLEYVVAYRADGVLLVDPEAGAIHEVDFDLARDAPPAPPPPSSIRSRVGWFAAGVVAGAIAAVAAVAPW